MQHSATRGRESTAAVRQYVTSKKKKRKHQCGFTLSKWAIEHYILGLDNVCLFL